MGGVSIREVCRYESSAGDSGVPICWLVCRGAMALANWALILVVVVVGRFCLVAIKLVGIWINNFEPQWERKWASTLHGRLGNEQKEWDFAGAKGYPAGGVNGSASASVQGSHVIRGRLLQPYYISVSDKVFARLT